MPGTVHPASIPLDRAAGAISDYKVLRDRIFSTIARMLELGLTERQSCLELKEKLDANTFNLVVVGQFKRGKTFLINALLGADLLPTAVVPLTSIVTILVYGEKLGAEVYFAGGRTLDIPVESLSEYVTENGNPRNEKDVREVVVRYPSPYLKDGVRLVDTPGVGSVYIHNTDVAYRYLPKSDAALFLLSVDQPASSAEVEFLKDVRGYADRIFFLLNKTDYLEKTEVDRALAFSRETLERVMGSEVKIFPVSAKLALAGKLGKSPEELQRSGLPLFSEVLDRFLMKEKGKVLLESASRNLLRILAGERLATELELKALATPIEQIREKIKSFEEKREELLRERRNFDALFKSELDRLVIAELDRGLDELKSKLIAEMEEEFNAFYEQRKDLSLKDLNDALAGFVKERIELEFSSWRDRQEETLSLDFEGICRRFASQLNEVLDSLLDFSSQLFSVPFERIEADSLWSSESSFYYKLREEPVGLDMLSDSLTQVFPKYIRGKWFVRFREWAFRTANHMIVGKRKRHMLEMIEMQAGRLRFDFIDRVDRSSRAFKADMIKKMDTVVDGIAAAIERGIDLRSRGEKEAAMLEAALTSRLATMNDLRAEVSRVQEDAENI